MRVLIACEFSGIVRDAFIEKGHDAMSCDLLPTESPGPHHQGDVFDVLDDGWDLMIAHPPCTYIANSGVRWLYEQEGRWELMKQGAKFFLKLLNAEIPMVAVENPIPHKHAGLPPYTQLVQPYNFGHNESKATCLWLHNLPPLMATEMVRDDIKHTVHQLPPSPGRSKLRSVTFRGIAAAMANQWGNL